MTPFSSHPNVSKSPSIRHRHIFTSGITIRRPQIDPLDICLLLIGAVINTASYLSIEPALIAVGVYALFYGTLSATAIGGVPEWRTFSRVYGVCFVMAGVAAVYANQLVGQLPGDAAGFFNMATTDAKGLSIVEIERLSEGAIAIWAWRAVYEFFDYIGFEKLPYVGICFNITVVSLSGVFGIKMARLIFGEDAYRFQQLTLLLASCGLIWLLSAVHLRDGLVFLMVTVTTYVWLWFVKKPSLERLILITAVSLTAASVLLYLRREFVFVPFGLMIAAIVSLGINAISRRGHHASSIILATLGVIVTIGLVSNYGESLFLALQKGTDSYAAVARETGAGGLGYSVIVSQSPLIKILLGSLYLFVFPIPVWTGLQLDSAYHLFKSLNAPFFYALIPLLLISTGQLALSAKTRSKEGLFLLFVSVGFVFSVAATSLETRHLTAFLMPIFLLAILPDFRSTTIRKRYRAMFTIWLFFLVLIHMAWGWLKI